MTPLARQVFAIPVLAALFAAPAAAQQIDRINQVGRHFRTCFAPAPGAVAGDRAEVTIRFTMRRDGSLMAEPRITFVSLQRDSAAGKALVEAALRAVTKCAPAPLSPALGAAIAGRPFTMRFIVERDRISSVDRIEQQHLAPDARAGSPLKRLERRRELRTADPIAPAAGPPLPSRWTDPPPPINPRGQQDELLIKPPQQVSPRPRLSN